MECPPCGAAHIHGHHACHNHHTATYSGFLLSDGSGLTADCGTAGAFDAACAAEKAFQTALNAIPDRRLALRDDVLVSADSCFVTNKCGYVCCNVNAVHNCACCGGTGRGVGGGFQVEKQQEVPPNTQQPTHAPHVQTQNTRTYRATQQRCTCNPHNSEKAQQKGAMRDPMAPQMASVAQRYSGQPSYGGPSPNTQGYSGQQSYGGPSKGGPGYSGQQSYGGPSPNTQGYSGQQSYGGPSPNIHGYSGQQSYGGPSRATQGYSGQQSYGGPSPNTQGYSGQQSYGGPSRATQECSGQQSYEEPGKPRNTRPVTQSNSLLDPLQPCTYPPNSGVENPADGDVYHRTSTYAASGLPIDMPSYSNAESWARRMRVGH